MTIVKKIIFKIRIWKPPDWFVNPFFSPELHYDYYFADSQKEFIKLLKETLMLLEKLTKDAEDKPNDNPTNP